MPDTNTFAEMLASARAVATRAHAPYSKFRVGAAVRGATGRIHVGCNVENASFGLTSCAERNAVFAAIAAGETTIEEVVLYTPTATPTPPCGACRQVLAEFGRTARIHVVCDGPDVLETTVAALLPHGFDGSALK